MKKVFCLFFFFQLLSFSGRGQTSEFNQPWLDSTKAIIIDPYGDNEIDFDKLLTDKRVVGIIHKASQGYSADRKYYGRKLLAKQKGLLWGSYHLGMRGDGKMQADFYLNTIQNDTSELMALDLEGLDTNSFMSLKNAERFIYRIHEKTKRYPVVYCNNTVLEEIGKKYNDTSIFSKCGLWYARYLKELPNFNKNVWSAYTFWQFSCEVNCSETGKCWYNVPGTLYDMDVNVYNGSIAELKLNWPNIIHSVNPVIAHYNWLNSFDLDGDNINDKISFTFSEGAHCCYKIFITLSTDKKEQSFPFEMDGGYISGVDNSWPDQFNISNIDSDSLPEITMKIQSYNWELSPIPKKWQKKYGIKTNFIVFQYEKGKLTVSDQKR